MFIYLKPQLVTSPTATGWMPSASAVTSAQYHGMPGWMVPISYTQGAVFQTTNRRSRETMCVQQLEADAARSTKRGTRPWYEWLPVGILMTPARCGISTFIGTRKIQIDTTRTIVQRHPSRQGGDI